MRERERERKKYSLCIILAILALGVYMKRRLIKYIIDINKTSCPIGALGKDYLAAF